MVSVLIVFPVAVQHERSRSSSGLIALKFVDFAGRIFLSSENIFLYEILLNEVVCRELVIPGFS